MSNLTELKKQAKRAAKFRGHKLSEFGFTIKAGCSGIRGGYRCLNCGRLAIVETNPPANGIEVGGEAVAVNCDKAS